MNCYRVVLRCDYQNGMAVKFYTHRQMLLERDPSDSRSKDMLSYDHGCYFPVYGETPGPEGIKDAYEKALANWMKRMTESNREWPLATYEMATKFMEMARKREIREEGGEI